MRVVVLAFLVAAGGIGCGGSQACQPGGQACDVTHLCCGPYECANGQCVLPTSCGKVGAACSGSSCCGDLTCSSGVCAAPATCHVTGQSCSTMYDCCQGSTCPRFGSTCTLGSIGDPCQQNADCASNLTCNGTWCSKNCASNAECGSTNDCIADSSGGYSCFPYCGGGGATCAYLPGTACTVGSGPIGESLTICSP